MANWFKIFEVDLDESRMRYALSKLPETWPVWTAVLIECCRHRAESFSWGNGEQELFGFSDRLKISIPKVNAAISLLCEIKYCELIDGKLKVLKWNEKQDDYLARKSRGYWEKRRENKDVTVNHSESHIEEKRGEEKKRDKRVAAKESPSTDAEWILSLKSNPAYLGLDVDKEFHKMNAWCSTNGKMPSRRRFVNWLNRSEKPIAKQNHQPVGGRF